jgi:hypothetical protein
LKQYIKHTLAIYIAGLLIAITQPGCKEHTIISSGFAPGINGITIATDSFTILTKTKYYDSVPTNNSRINIYMGMGIANDPLVGKTNAGLYFQVIPPKGFIYSNYTIDSAFVILPYSGFTYGDNSSRTATKNYAVYGITDPTYPVDTATYFANTQTAANKFYFTANTNLYHLADSISIGGVNYIPHMRLKIPKSGYQLLTDLMQADANSATLPGYITQFRGIYIEEADTSGSNPGVAIPYVQLDGGGYNNYDHANILLYAHTNGMTDVVQISFPFSTTYCAHYNKISHVYNSAGAAFFQSTASSDAQVLLENGPGAVIDVKVGGIRSLKRNDTIPIINQAQLKFTISTPNATYLPPFSTSPYSVYTLPTGYDVLSQIADRYPLLSSYPSSFIGGTRDSTGTTYTLNVPRELQLALSKGYDTLHLRINGSTDFWGAYRAVIGGGNNTNSAVRMKFNVVYSRIK